MREQAQSDPYEICKRVQFGSQLSSPGVLRLEEVWARWGNAKAAGWNLNTSMTGGLLMCVRCYTSAFSIDTRRVQIHNESRVAEPSRVISCENVVPWKRSNLSCTRSRVIICRVLSFHSAIEKSQSVDKQIWKEDGDAKDSDLGTACAWILNHAVRCEAVKGHWATGYIHLLISGFNC